MNYFKKGIPDYLKIIALYPFIIHILLYYIDTIFNYPYILKDSWH